jgi:hypothetical protein
LEAGETIDFTFTPAFGDVDVSVFAPFTDQNAPRVALSANNGTVPETVTLVGPGLYQIEVRAIVNSRFTVTYVESFATFSLPPTTTPLGGDEAQPTVAGPPARRTAIGEPTELYLPVVIRP